MSTPSGDWFAGTQESGRTGPVDDYERTFAAPPRQRRRLAVTPEGVFAAASAAVIPWSFLAVSHAIHSPIGWTGLTALSATSWVATTLVSFRSGKLRAVFGYFTVVTGLVATAIPSALSATAIAAAVTALIPGGER